jgi:ferredoxin-type protein NapG
MDRRGFFKAGLNQVAKTAVDVADEVVSQRARHWIRPPYALPELEFLLACTRCDACVDACPHNVIFKLPARRGAQLVGTPALDLLNKGCHLCEDWPCVQACEPKALTLPETEEDEQAPMPLMAMAAINTETCLPYHGPECGACAPACPVPDAMIWKMEKPKINQETCTGCGLCREACILEPKAINIHSLHSD